MYNSVKALLCSIKSCVQLNCNDCTEWFDILNGVRQDDPLSPSLFSLYINDLAKHLKENGPTLNFYNLSINCLMYADGMVLIAETGEQLQKLLDLMYVWCKKWRLKVNKGNTKVVHFGPQRRKRSKYEFDYDGEKLESVSNYKYLGVILDGHLKFDSCARSLAEAAGRALGAVISKFKMLKNVDYVTFKKMYGAGVKTVYEYSSGVWGYIKSKDTDMVQSRAMRYFLDVHRFAPTAGKIGDMGWIRPGLSRILCMARLWNRFINMENSRLTKCIFNWDLNEHAGWGTELKGVFNELDMDDIFVNWSLCDLDNVNQRMLELATVKWKDDTVSKPKLRTYIKFKDALNPENYAMSIINRQ